MQIPGPSITPYESPHYVACAADPHASSKYQILPLAHASLYRRPRHVLHSFKADAHSAWHRNQYTRCPNQAYPWQAYCSVDIPFLPCDDWRSQLDCRRSSTSEVSRSVEARYDTESGPRALSNVYGRWSVATDCRRGRQPRMSGPAEVPSLSTVEDFVNSVTPAREVGTVGTCFT